MTGAKPDYRRTLSRLWVFIRPARTHFFWAVALVSAAVLLQFPIPLVSAAVLDELTSKRRLPAAAIAALFGLGLLLLAARFAQNYFAVKFAERTKAALVSALSEKALFMPLRDSRAYPSGYLLSRVRDDVRAIDSVMESIHTVIGDCFTMALGSVVLFQINPRLASAALLQIPVYVAILKSRERRFRRAAWRAMEDSAVVSSEIQATLADCSLIKASASERFHLARIAQAVARLVGAQIDSAMTAAVTRLIAGAITVLGPALIFWIGAREYVEGRLSIGQLFAFNAYLAYLLGSANGLVSIHMAVQNLMVALSRAFQILDTPDEENAGAGRPIGSSRRAEIALSGVSFAYHPGEPVLRNVDLRAGNGELIALVGASGAGKSTIASLLLRLYDSYEGRICLDGDEIRTLDPAQLRRFIALVPQESAFVNGTVEENIRYDTQATEDEVRQAAAESFCDEFISRMPHGYQTLLGENGFNLSTGQRQRIAIARALLRRPRVLILDEATSGLDAGSESRIREALERLRGSMTCMIIAHRLYTVTAADRIYFLEEGRVISQGGHHELYRRCRSYARLYDQQREREATLPGPEAAAQFVAR